ncbi:MAG: ABC transporter ATP-binding protein [Desulfobacterales bacterium]|nr:ABC transporter ATP-binding protein [Desulfobacterales bacterium]
MLLSVEHLKTYFHTPRGVIKAVDDVSFSLNKGEVLGLVGESGCGKSVTSQSIMRLIPEPPGKIEGGKILFDGRDIASLPLKEMKSIRGNRISMIFQEPMTSLNPVKTIGWQIGEMFRLHRNVSRKESIEMAVDMLAKVQIPEPAKRVRSFPHQLSGGMRQRAMIAMALSCDPEILIADEPTTALDVTVQAQILDLMKRLSRDFNTAILMITHDLGVIADIADRVMVMYAGKAVESASTGVIFKNPGHPYTRGLLGSVPVLGQSANYTGTRTRLNEIKGMVPSLSDLPEGCFFYPRCGQADDLCKKRMPPLAEREEGHWVRCWH